MIESPLMKEFAEKIELQTRRTDIEDMIQGRFSALSDSARASLEGLNDQAKLRGLLLFAGLCKTKEEFLERLAEDAAACASPDFFTAAAQTVIRRPGLRGECGITLRVIRDARQAAPLPRYSRSRPSRLSQGACKSGTISKATGEALL